MLLNDIGTAFCYIKPPRPDPKHETRIMSSHYHCRRGSPAKKHWEIKDANSQSICTADELHSVSVSNSDWKLALWRYLPSPKVQKVFNFTFFFIPFCYCNDISSGFCLISLFISQIKGNKKKFTLSIFYLNLMYIYIINKSQSSNH